MKIISWNVNGLRACIQKGFADFFREADADVFAVQETKLQPHQFELELPGREVYLNSAQKKGYSGTAVISRTAPLSVSLGMGVEEHDREGRIIVAEYEGFRLLNVYVPNSQRELARLEYRMRWEEAFREFCRRLDADKPLVICGDMNVAHAEIDLKNPASNRRNAGFTDEERGCMTQLLESGFTDVFRALYPERVEYTWWSYMNNARARNIGWRIDYFIVSDRFMANVEDCEILPNVLGSDHCPVALQLRGDAR
ncbi:MAG: exodeoxyribonuclease III [Clostridia bacterium]|nr:exodeoxyribonuclease III [Clostridia bacterium]